jgi:hypothetical protein
LLDPFLQLCLAEAVWKDIKRIFQSIDRLNIINKYCFFIYCGRTVSVYSMSSSPLLLVPANKCESGSSIPTLVGDLRSAPVNTEPPQLANDIRILLDTLDLERLTGKLVGEDGFRDVDFAREAILEYKKFFFMLTECEYGENLNHNALRRFLPSSFVDLVWQRHMLDTARYFEDCERFDMPGGYCHRHELFATDAPNSTDQRVVSRGSVHQPTSPSGCAQADYFFTLEEYERSFGHAARKDIWPDQYDFVTQHEKRKTKTCDITGGHQEGKYLSFAVPHVIVPYSQNVCYHDGKYTVPNEEALIANLNWVGELVFDTLPLKQMRSLRGQAIGKISFQTERITAVAKVVREYARFLILVMQKNYMDTDDRNGKDDFEQSLEVTPSKLVDELWHAHILCSPAYFSFW